MASTPKPNILSYVAGGTIVKGHAVKIGADNQHVVECTAATDKVIGIAQISGSSGDVIEVARPGGGAKAVAQTTIVAGKLLVSHTDGTIKPIAAAGDRLVAVAEEDAAAGDIFAVTVIMGQAYQTE